MTETFDVIIIGAGPAGSCCAAAAAAEGASVLMLEEHAQIGVPLQCAEGLSRSTIKDWLEIRPEWIATHLNGSLARGPDGDEFRVEYPNVGWVLNRKVFDPALAEIARKQGAVLKVSCRATGIEGNKVRVLENTSPGEYRFRHLIAADGVASRCGAWLGIDTRLKLTEIEVCAQYVLENLQLDPAYACLIFGNQHAPGGYGWIFPKSAHHANVGLGIAPLSTQKKAIAFLDEWVKREFPQARIRDRVFGGVPAKILKKFSGPNFFLIGDAGRFTDPLSGGGIANAVKSGMIAGRNAVLRIRGKKNRFEAEIKKEILDEVKFHHRVRRAYLKFSEEDHRRIFKMGRNFFEGKTVTDINTRELVAQGLKALPHLLRLGIKLI
jgi:digeranylgeranylglycerophospholipid reductase